jgi:hypothetical protein
MQPRKKRKKKVIKGENENETPTSIGRGDCSLFALPNIHAPSPATTGTLGGG